MSIDHGVFTFGFQPTNGHYAQLERLVRRSGVSIQRPPEWRGQRAELVLVSSDALGAFEQRHREHARRTGVKVRSALLLRQGERQPDNAMLIVNTVMSIANGTHLLEVIRCPNVLGLRQIVAEIPRSLLQLIALDSPTMENWRVGELPLPEDVLAHANRCGVYRTVLIRELKRRIQEERHLLTSARELLYAAWHPEASQQPQETLHNYLHTAEVIRELRDLQRLADDRDDEYYLDFVKEGHALADEMRRAGVDFVVHPVGPYDAS